MEDRWKENDRQMGNNKVPLTPPAVAAIDRAVDRVLKTPTFTCSPVREEDELFEEDPQVLEKSLTRDYKLARRSGTVKRRQTLGGMSTASSNARRVSIGSLHGTIRKPVIKRSFGKTPTSRGGLSSYEQHAMNDLKDELNKREKLDHTRQHRLNALDIKCKEAENRLQMVQTRFREIKKEKADLVRQNNELKRQNKLLMASKRRLVEQKKQQEQTISALLAKVGNGSLRRKPIRKKPVVSTNTSLCTTASTTASTNASVTGSIGGSSPAEDDDETFIDGEDVLATFKKTTPDASAGRRYTMAPGEASRMRSSSHVAPKESHSIRLDCMAKGSMSKDAAAMCKDYGLVVHARITKCIVSGELKGYVTFAESRAARQALIDLRAKGYAVHRVDDA